MGRDKRDRHDDSRRTGTTRFRAREERTLTPSFLDATGYCEKCGNEFRVTAESGACWDSEKKIFFVDCPNKRFCGNIAYAHSRTPVPAQRS